MLRAQESQEAALDCPRPEGALELEVTLAKTSSALWRSPVPLVASEQRWKGRGNCPLWSPETRPGMVGSSACCLRRGG